MSKFVDLLNRRRTHFVLWRPAITDPAPAVCLLKLVTEVRDRLYRYFDLRPNPEFPDLWEVPATECELEEGQVYHYWYVVKNSEPYDEAENFEKVVHCTDPIATCVNRLEGPPVIGGAAKYPSIILFKDQHLVQCDPQGEEIVWEHDDPPTEDLPPNNKLIIYEMPTRWTRIDIMGRRKELVGKGTFKDVIVLCEADAKAEDLPEVLNDRAHLLELGVNALEILPPGDHDDSLTWGYGTGNFFAPDFNLGEHGDKYTPNVDLADLVQSCHKMKIRFFIDVVMAFSRNNPYHNVNFSDFYLKHEPNMTREAYGGDLFDYDKRVTGYNPITGKQSEFVPSREYMKAHIAHWMESYHVDGLRLDSINNIENPEFLQEFKEFARDLWRRRGGTDDRFLVVGEDLMVPIDIVHQARLDGLWNERFKHLVRRVLIGQNGDNIPDFDTTVKQMIDIRNMGFADGSQSINYLTSHDVGGLGNERIYNYLVHCGVKDVERRIKLGFACLLTAVGIPMILAGEEFGEQHDKDISGGETPQSVRNKQTDPVHYERLEEDWRKRIFDYVSRLCKFRTSSESLCCNETSFIHSDYEEDKRVVAWVRGPPVSDPLSPVVVVVANFSDYSSPPDAIYHVHNWPETPENMRWVEIVPSGTRVVPPEMVSNEPINAWEARIYTVEAC